MLYKEEKKKRKENLSMLDEKKINLLMPNKDMMTMENFEEIKELQDGNNDFEVCEDSSGVVRSRTHHMETERNVYMNSFEDEDSDNLSDYSDQRGIVVETTTKAFQEMERKMALQNKTFSKIKQKKTLMGNLGNALVKPFRTLRNLNPKEKKEKTVGLPVYFRYFSINEIGVALTYKHSESSFLNTKNLRITIKPFIKNGKILDKINYS